MPVRPGMPIYPGNPPVEIVRSSSVVDGASANVSAVSLGSHTGTHIDAPRHFFDDAPGVEGVALERLVGPAIVLEFSDDVRSVGAAEFSAYDGQVRGESRVLLHTRNSQLLNEGAFVRNYTFLAPDGASYLLDRGVVLVGVDYLSIEQFRSGHHRTHHLLLGAGAVIVEGLDLSHVSAGRYTLVAFPCCLWESTALRRGQS